MTPAITIIYAYHNRDSRRVLLSLQSLQQQTNQGFEVVFVDYGSEPSYAQAVAEVVSTFDFASYHDVGHPGLLWNKSKALNYGIRQAKGDYVFIADVDILFHPDSVKLFHKIAAAEQGHLFNLAYLDENTTKQLDRSFYFETLQVKHTGSVNGMILVSRTALEQVHGLDEFFHFYGSEDVDLFQRLEHAGQELIHREELFFKHQWHPIYNKYNDGELSITPRLYNIKRINQQHFFYHRSESTVVPEGMEQWGKVYKPEDAQRLDQPDIKVVYPNTHAAVVHFLDVVLPQYKGQIVRIDIREDTYYRSLKHHLKKLLKKQSVPYISIKTVNDMILSRILFKYYNHNYSFKVNRDYKGITFVLDQKENL